KMRDCTICCVSLYENEPSISCTCSKVYCISCFKTLIYTVILENKVYAKCRCDKEFNITFIHKLRNPGLKQIKDQYSEYFSKLLFESETQKLNLYKAHISNTV